MNEPKKNLYTAIKDAASASPHVDTGENNIYSVFGMRDTQSFEGHYTNRYKKRSESVDAYDTDMQDAFNKGEVLPDSVPRETLGMPEAQHNLMTLQRVEANQMRIDNPSFKFNKDGELVGEHIETDTPPAAKPAKEVDGTEIPPAVEPVKEVDGTETPPAVEAVKEIDGTEVPPAVEVDDRIEMYNDLSYTDKVNVQKMGILNELKRNIANRTIIDPDQVFDPDTGMNMALKVVTEIGEGIVEGFENTARSAAILGYEIFPPSDPIGQAYADILNSNAISTTDLRAGILPDVKDAEGIGYGFLRGIGQFAPNFMAFNKVLSGFSALRSANITRGFLAGMPADALAFDSVDGNLHDLAISAGEVDIPGIGTVNLDNEYTQFMSASAQDTQAEGRFRNVVEGGLIGTAFDAAMRGAGRAYTTAQKAGVKKKFTELYVSTAKNLRDFRVDSANRLETDAIKTLSSLEPNAKPEQVKPLSEIALSKLMKGEATDFDSWKKIVDDDLPEIFKRQSGDDADVKGAVKLYHGTDQVFDEFDVTKAADGTIWFTDKIEDITDPSRGVTASGKGEIVERFLPDNLKLADEDLIDKHSVDELIQQGYDGVRYEPDENAGAFYQIFHPEKLELDDVPEMLKRQSGTGFEDELTKESWNNAVEYQESMSVKREPKE